MRRSARAAMRAVVSAAVGAAVGVVVVAATFPGTHPDTLIAARADGPAARAGAWLASIQSDDGAFGAGQPADGVAETVASLVAAGTTGVPIERALGFVAAHGPERAAERGAYAARIVLGLSAAGLDPTDFHGVDYVAMLEEHAQITGELDTGLYAQAIATLGLVAGRGEVPAAVVRYIRANECRAGGFGHERGCLGGGDTDTTAMILVALLAAGVEPGDALIERGLRFLGTARTDDGGYGLTPGGATNANSTGLAVSALLAAGEPVGAAVRALRELQAPAGGFRYLASQSGPNRYATVQAIPAVARASYPIRPAARAVVTMPDVERRGAAPVAGSTLARPPRDQRPVTGNGVDGADRRAPVLTARAAATPAVPPRAAPITAAAVLLGLTGAARLALRRRP